MKKLLTLTCIVVLLIAPQGTVLADVPDVETQEATLQNETNWRLSGGAQYRFGAGKVKFDDGMIYAPTWSVPSRTSGGSGSSNASVDVTNDAWADNTMSHNYSVSRDSQIQENYLYSPFYSDRFGFDFYYSAISASSRSTRYSSQSQTFATDGSADLKDDWGPYLRLDRTVYRSASGKFTLDLNLSWAYHDYNASNGPLTAYELSCYKKTTRASERRAAGIIDIFGGNTTWPGAPFDVVDGVPDGDPTKDAMIVEDADAFKDYVSQGGLEDYNSSQYVSRSRSSNTNRIALYQSTVEDSLKLKMNIIDIGAMLTFKPHDRVSLFLAAALLLNHIDYTLKREEILSQIEPTVEIIQEHTSKKSGSKWKAGGYVSVGVRVVIGKGWFCEGSLGYEFFDNCKFNNDAVSASFDPSAAKGNFMFGKEF